MIAGRLSRDGDLKTAGINTRLPLVTDGLLAHFPFDGTTKGIRRTNLINLDEWWRGDLDDITQLNATYGVEHSLVEDIGPSGQIERIWRAHKLDGTVDEGEVWNGGYASVGVPIDNTKKYRISVWIDRKVSGGTTYFGTLGPYTVKRLSTDSADNNPYFWAGGPSVGWKLYVGYVYPHDTDQTSISDDSGIYVNGVKITSTTQFKFTETATAISNRAFLYRSNRADTIQDMTRVRIDLCDGSEPTLDELLACTEDSIDPDIVTDCTLGYGGLAVEDNNPNIIDPLNVVAVEWSDMDSLHRNYTSPTGGTASFLETYYAGGIEWFITGREHPVTPGGTYTISAKVKYNQEPHPNLFYLRQYRSTGVQISEQGIFNYASRVDLGDGWVFASRTFTLHSECASITVQGYQYTGGVRVWIEDLKVEEGDVPTSHNLGIGKSGNASISIPPITEGTIIGKFLSRREVSANQSESVDYTMLTIHDYLNGGMASFRCYLRGLYLTTSGSVWNGDDGGDMDIEAGYLWYTIDRSGLDITMTLWQNGNWLREFNISVPLNSQIDKISFGSNPIWDGIHSDISVYNRLLSEDEKLMVIKGTHSFNEDGLRCKSLSTLSDLGNDVYYADMGIDGLDLDRIMIPHLDTAVHSNGVAVTGAGTIQYNLHESIGLDWSADWTIAYMKRPIYTYSGGYSRFSTETMGSNSNLSAGRGYFWWGKNDNANSTIARMHVDGVTYTWPTGGFLPPDYFNEWQYVTIVKSGDNITVSFHLSDGTVHSDTMSISIPDADYFVNGYGYDLMLGGWDDSNYMHTEYANLFVSRKAMSDDDLSNLVKAKMRSKSDRVYVQRGVDTTSELI